MAERARDWKREALAARRFISALMLDENADVNAALRAYLDAIKANIGEDQADA